MATKTQINLTQILRGIKTPAGFERQLTDEWYSDHPNPETRKKVRAEYGKAKVLRFISPTVRITIGFVPTKWIEEGKVNYSIADGHVEFDVPGGGTRTFDRYGIEDSFYVDNPREDYHPWREDYVVVDDVHGSGQRHGVIVAVPHYEGFGDERHFVDEGYQILWDGDEEPTVYTEKELGQIKLRKDVIAATNATIQEFVDKRIPEALARIARSTPIPGVPFSVTPEGKSEIQAKLQHGERHTLMPSGFGTGYVLMTRPTPYAREASRETAAFFGVPVLYIETFDAD